MQPTYLEKPIGSPEALAGVLGLSVTVLTDFAATASSKYTHFEIDKANGKKREISSPNHDLKIIQKRINRFVFGKVKYPEYLFGGIEGRDYVKNASIHANAKALITLDIKDFYPNIQAKHVFKIFKYFCKFPDSVATLLTDLTTLKGSVPQGACTSSHIANLVFYDTEHRIVREFSQKKLSYSRLLDDMCISSTKVMSASTLKATIDSISAVLHGKNFKLKSSKTKISSASNPEDLMEVTGLWLNRGHPRVRRAERIDIRSELFRCEELFKISRTSPEYHREHDRLSGRVAKLSYLKHSESKPYRARLRKILPHYDLGDRTKTLKLVNVIERTSVGDRSKYSYIERFHQLMYRINILSRSDTGLAQALRIRMSLCQPTSTKEKITYGE
ncbi:MULTISPECIES: reverse transcriptase family protein [Polaromonas]|uniref:RNA-directed DNA polymerase n=1 Tax=Polaromonas aquatica TaxID=332657 RepID=A0ABW1U647_9BURK